MNIQGNRLRRRSTHFRGGDRPESPDAFEQATVEARAIPNWTVWLAVDHANRHSY